MASISDDFNRADGNPGANWNEDSGDWAIGTNRLLQATAGSAYYKCRWVGTALDSSDYDSEIDGVSSDTVAPLAFGRGAASATVTYYGFIGFGGAGWYIVEITGGSEGILDGPDGTCTTGTTYNVRLRCNSSTQTGYVNDVSTCTASDATLASGAVGVGSYGILNGTQWADNFAAADLAAAGRTTRNTDPRPLGIFAGISRKVNTA